MTQILSKKRRHAALGLRILIAILLAILCGLTPVPAFAGNNVTLILDHIMDSNKRTFLDKSIYLNYEQLYGIAFLGNWQKGGEFGGYFFDARGATYSSYIRFREFDASYQIATEQPVSNGYVAKLQFRSVHISELEKKGDPRNLTVFGLGFDKYYGDYHYFSAMYYNDPRESGRFSIVLSNTFSTKESYLRLGLVPRSDGSTGYFTTLKHRWVFVGYAFTREFDFATFNRKVFTFGLSVPMKKIGSVLSFSEE